MPRLHSAAGSVRRVREELDLRLLRDRRVRRLTLAQMTSATGDGIVIAVLPFAIQAAGGSDVQFSIALAVQALAMASLFLPAGVVGDRFNRRSVVVASDLLRFGARGAIALLLILGDATFWQLLITQAVHGAGSALFYTTMDGFVPEVIDGEKLLRKLNALRFVALSLGMAIGPAIGGLIYAKANAGWAFGLDAMTFLVSASLICRLPTPFAVKVSEPVSLRALASDVGEGWKAFRSIGWYWRVASEFAVLNTLVFAPYFVIGPHIAKESLGGSGAWAAILMALGIGQLVGALIILAWEPARPLQTATKLVAVWVLPLLLLAVLAPIDVLVVGVVLAGVSVAVFSAIWETTKQTHTPPHVRARLGSFDHLGSLGLVPFGYLLGAAMLAAVGAEAALIAGAAIMAVATLAVASDPSIRGLKPISCEVPGSAGQIVLVADGSD